MNDASKTGPGASILRVREFATRDRPLFGWMPRSVAERLRPRLDIPKLDIRAGHCYAVIGKSGAGKTVFNSFLMGWPAFQCGRGTQAGEIRWWNGEREIRLDAGQVANPLRRLFAWRKIGRHGVLFYLPQLLPDGRGYAMPTRAYLRHVLAALRDQARVKDIIGSEFDGLPKDIADNLDKSLDRLSGGERRRVELWARLRVLRDFAGERPGLLVLDEPTTGLDVVQERKYMDMLRDGLQENPGVAALVTTHAMNLLDPEECDGKPVFDGVIVVWKKVFKSSRWKHKRSECDVSPVFNPIVAKSGTYWEDALDLFKPQGIPEWSEMLNELVDDETAEERDKP